jgi:hypothetical protein
MADEGKKKYTSAELSKWLIEKAAEARNPGIARRIITTNDQRGRSTAMIGRMYFFKYEPIYGYRMPKYDKFPMCIPIERKNNGFLGLNLHYLPAGGRQKILELLLMYKSEALISDKTKMNISYDIIKSNSTLEKYAEPCIHRYIWGQCRSRFIEIYPAEFEKAIQLPVEDWVFNQ